MAQDDAPKMNPYQRILMRPQSWGDLGSDQAQRLSDDLERAHDTAVKAGGFQTTRERKQKFGGKPVDPGT